MSSRDIKDLVDYMQEPARLLIERAKFGDWQAFITDGFRTVEEQNRLYAQGRTLPGKKVTNAKGGESDHNTGNAIDIAFKNSTGQVSYNVDLFKKAWVIAKDLAFKWGG